MAGREGDPAQGLQSGCCRAAASSHQHVASALCPRLTTAQWSTPIRLRASPIVA